MNIERDQDFEQVEDIAAMMAENPGIEFENGNYVYYGLDGRTAFAAVYISGAWAGWQAKDQALQEKPHQFNLDEFLSMEEKLQSKGGVITADLDRFIAYAEMVLEKAKSPAVPEGFAIVPKKSTDWQRVNVRDMEPDIEDYENMSKMDWENLCGEIYDRMVEVGPE